MNQIPYIPGLKLTKASPLARFLPPIEEGIGAAWLAGHVGENAWVLDPFGGSPQQVVRQAREGYRVLVAANNPIARFLLEMRANPPAESDYKAALAALAISRKGGTHLESHLKDLYQTECAKCKQMVIADAFLWRKDADVPFARVYTCANCGDKGERLTTAADEERALDILASAKLHSARVLERVAPLGDPDREYAEEALHAHLPRAIYVLTTLINRLDSLSLTPARQRALTALFLTTCDAANTLYPHPDELSRPKQLRVPAQFYEHNLWLALERGITLWASENSPIPLTIFPELPPKSGGICLYEGKLKDLASKENIPKFDAVLTAIPRPNMAFWILSALWSGWLWGREAAEPFKVGLRRRRYDWGWHAAALQAAFGHLGKLLPEKTPLFALLAEPEPSFLSAALIAASPKFALKNLAIRTKDDPIQILWERTDSFPLRGKARMGVGYAVKKHLLARGEAATYLHLHAQALSEFARTQNLLLPQEIADNALDRIHARIDEELRTHKGLIRYEGSEKSLSTGLWGLSSAKDSEIPLADRVEKAIVRYLSHNPNKNLFEIEKEIYPQFAGLLTPSKGLVAAVLDSYAHLENSRWSLRFKDAPSARHANLDEMRALITDIGLRLGHQTKQINDKLLIWGDEKKPVYIFHLIASALVQEIFEDKTFSPDFRSRSIILLPGGRAGLLAYKQKRDPALRAASENWRFIKFRLLRTVGEIPIINAQTWEEQIGSDPVEEGEKGQLMMF
ncbi:MAG: hypothetical protein GY755_07925 [Chloroflexi bacterium]|nr:hypothetical protein [Chloroflexota bacterium]